MAKANDLPKEWIENMGKPKLVSEEFIFYKDDSSDGTQEGSNYSFYVKRRYVRTITLAEASIAQEQIPWWQVLRDWLK